MRIPKSLAVGFDIQPGAEVDLTVVNGKLVATPVSEPTYTLDQLLAGVTKRNLPTEVDMGCPVGGEVW
jgi:antitoxin MazE